MRRLGVDLGNVPFTRATVTLLLGAFLVFLSLGWYLADEEPCGRRRSRRSS